MRIYNPQNQLGQNLATELSLNNAKELILKGMGLTEENISKETFKSLKTLIDTNAAQIETLQSSKLGFAFVDALPETGQQENIIYLVKDASKSTSETNLYTEYIAVFKTEGGSKSFDRWEEIGEVGLDLAGITAKIAAKTGDLTKLDTSDKDTLVAAINEVNGIATTAVQNVKTTTTGAGNNGVTLAFVKDDDNIIQTTLTVTPATLDDVTKKLSGEGFATGTQVQSAIAQAIDNADSDVDDKEIAMFGSDSDDDSKKHVTVAITGTIGNHTLAVTTKDIASAALLGTIDDTATDNTAFGMIAAEADARATAISDLSGTEDTAEHTSSDGFVTVSLTGTVGNHGLTVTTSDIAKASKDVSSTSTSTDTHVTVTLGGKVEAPTVAVTTADIASAALLGTAADTADVTTTAFGKIAAANAAITAETQRAAGVEGTLASLTTEAKDNLVAAINEVDDHADKITALVGTLPEGESKTVVAFASAQAETAKNAAIGSSVATINGTSESSSDIIKVTATTTDGSTSEGTGATVALAAEFTAATITDGVLSGNGLASGSQVQSAIAKAVKDIADGQTVSIGQVLVSDALTPTNGVITVNPKEGVDAIRILDVQASNGIVWVGEINNS